jgi:ArsR family transcriptional regulator, arsenate/arsenite/antimonite-responsive transcriptional repressor
MDGRQYRCVSNSQRVLPVVDQALACCTPLGVEVMTADQAETITGLLKALADPIRLRLMSLIAAADEACVCDLTAPFDVSQPTISHHLKVLREAGLVDSERRGTWVWYRARREALDAVGGLFTTTLAPV